MEPVAGPSGHNEPAPTQGKKRTFENIDNNGRPGSENPGKKVFRQPVTFQLQLPGFFDFQELVLGQDGVDWQFIQRNYIRGDVTFTWGYKGGLPGEPVPFNGKMDESCMADAGYVLMVGRASLEELPVEDDNVLALWAIILKWHSLCSQSNPNPKPLKLSFHEHAMDTCRQARQGQADLPFDYPGVQSRLVRERALCTAQVKEILDKGGDNMGDTLEKWLITSCADVSLNFSDKIELVNFEWYFHANENDEFQRIRAERWRMAMLDRYPGPDPHALCYSW